MSLFSSMLEGGGATLEYVCQPDFAKMEGWAWQSGGKGSYWFGYDQHQAGLVPLFRFWWVALSLFATTSCHYHDVKSQPYNVRA